MATKNNDKKSETNIAEVKIVVPEGFELTDGGDIPPGWLPQQSEKNTRDADSVRLQRIENGMIESVSDVVTGEFCQVSAWNKQTYAIRNAIDGDGKKFNLLRLPESKGLYRALGFKKLGAVIQVVYRGSVKVDKGYAHKWDIYVKDAANNQLSEPRPDALILMSEEQREHLETMEKLRQDLASLKSEQQIKQLEHQKRRLLVGGFQDNAEMNFDDMDEAFGPLPTSKS